MGHSSCILLMSKQKQPRWGRGRKARATTCNALIAACCRHIPHAVLILASMRAAVKSWLPSGYFLLLPRAICSSCSMLNSACSSSVIGREGKSSSIRATTSEGVGCGFVCVWWVVARVRCVCTSVCVCVFTRYGAHGHTLTHARR